MAREISLEARQRFRQRMLNIELADEILDYLSEFVDRFVPISGTTTNDSFNTIYELEIPANKTYMVTFSVIGSVGLDKAGLKRTAVFINSGGDIQQVNIQQADFTSRTDNDFNARLIPGSNVIMIQVKSSSFSLTKWKGSLQIESLGE